MRRLFGHTERGKKGAIDGLNLFFGALLGANLGTLDGLKLVYYLQLAAVLAGTVIALRMISTAERRGVVLVVLALYGAALLALVTVPGLKPEGMSVDDLNRLVATLAVWLAFVLMIELSPTKMTPPGPEAPPT